MSTLQWQTPRLKYDITQGLSTEDMERIEQNIYFIRNLGLIFGMTTSEQDIYNIEIIGLDESNLENGVTINALIDTTNSGISFLNLNNLGNLPIINRDLSTLQGGELIGGSVCTITYLNGSWQLLGGTTVTTDTSKVTTTLHDIFDIGLASVVSVGRFNVNIPNLKSQQNNKLLIYFTTQNNGNDTLTLNSANELPLYKIDAEGPRPLTKHELRQNKLYILVQQENYYELITDEGVPVYCQNTEPVSPLNNTLWLDNTDINETLLKQFNENQWTTLNLATTGSALKNVLDVTSTNFHYCQIPGTKKLLQMGLKTVSSGAREVVIDFPIPFNTSCHIIIPIVGTTSNTDNIAIVPYVVQNGTNSCTIKFTNISGSTVPAFYVMWLAIGE